MIIDFKSFEYFIQPGVTDMRCGIMSLARKLQEDLGLNELDRKAFMFCGRDKMNIKILLWDNGFWLLQKRIYEGTFKWPENIAEASSLKASDVERILEGKDIFRKLPTSSAPIYF